MKEIEGQTASSLIKQNPDKLELIVKPILRELIRKIKSHYTTPQTGPRPDQPLSNIPHISEHPGNLGKDAPGLDGPLGTGGMQKAFAKGPRGQMRLPFDAKAPQSFAEKRLLAIIEITSS